MTTPTRNAPPRRPRPLPLSPPLRCLRCNVWRCRRRPVTDLQTCSSSSAPKATAGHRRRRDPLVAMLAGLCARDRAVGAAGVDRPAFAALAQRTALRDHPEPPVAAADRGRDRLDHDAGGRGRPPDRQSRWSTTRRCTSPPRRRRPPRAVPMTSSARPEPTTTVHDPGAGTATFSYEGPVSPTSSSTHPSTARPTTSARSSRTPNPSATAPPTTTGRQTTMAPHQTAAPHLTEAPPALAVSPPRSAPARRARTRDRGSANWTVRRVDHLWHIAEATLAARGGHAPDEATLATYWRRLIAANRDVLVDPSNPDLILPGQVFVLPES